MVLNNKLRYFNFILTEASPTDYLKECMGTGDSADKIDKLSEMVQGLEKALIDLKRDVSQQVRVILLFYLALPCTTQTRKWTIK